MTLNPLDTLAQLVATASVNPMGRSETGPAFYETRLTDHLEQLLHSLGLRTERQQVAPGRANLIARLDGEVPAERGGPLILFDAHQDTVPVDHMTIEPWKPAVRQGRLYGRGACDTKGGMAAMLTVIARLAAERPRGMPSVVMTCTVDEEYAFSGAAALVSSWTSASGGLIPRAPDAAVVAEPTGLDVIVAHKGVVRWRCHTSGRAAQRATRCRRERHLPNGAGGRRLGTISSRGGRRPGHASALRRVHHECRYGPRRLEHQYRSRSMQHRNRDAFPARCGRRIGSFAID